MSLKPNYEEQFWISLSDLKSLWKRHRFRLKRIALFFFSLSMLCFLFSEPRFIVTATFKQSSHHAEQLPQFSNFLKTMGWQENQVNASSVMLSKRLMKKVIEELGLQGKLSKKNALVTFFSRFWNNILAECLLPIEDKDDFTLAHVKFSEEKPVKLFLHFQDKEHFEVWDKNKNLLAEGLVNQPISFKGIQFTLLKTPQAFSQQKTYPMTLIPMASAIEQVKKTLSIKSTKTDKNILLLQFIYPQRHTATLFLNQLMESYAHYLREENEELSKAQLAYLEERQEELGKKLDYVLQEQASYLKKSAKKEGIIGVKEEVKLLQIPKEKYLSDLLEMDKNLKRFELPSEEAFTQQNGRPFSFFSDETKSVKEIAEVSSELKEATELLTHIETNNEVSASVSLIKHPRSILKILNDQIQAHKKTLVSASETEKINIEKEIKEKVEKCREHVHMLVDSLRDRKKRLEENLVRRKSVLNEYTSFDLAVASELLNQYQLELAKSHDKTKEALFIREQIHVPTFEMGSLSTFFSDPVGQDIVRKGAELSAQLQQESQHSLREQERLSQQLDTQKKLLVNHLEQIVELEKIKSSLLHDKIDSLKKISIAGIKKEKALIEEKLQDIHCRMTNLIDIWHWEEKFKLKTALSKGMMEGMTHLLETKNINSHLFQVDAHPLDHAEPPFKPSPRGILFYSLLIGGLAAGSMYFWLLVKALLKGFPVSSDLLQHLGLNLAGHISSLCDEPFSQMSNHDLETLRRLSSFILSHKKDGIPLCAACIKGSGPLFAQHIANLLHLQGFKILLLECHFQSVVIKDDLPGLWQYLNGDEQDVSLRKGLSYDRLPTGGGGRFVAEHLSHERFSFLLERFKKSYDIVLISSDAEARSTEAQLFMKYADALILVPREESIQELLVYENWQKKKETKSLSYVLANSSF